MSSAKRTMPDDSPRFMKRPRHDVLMPFQAAHAPLDPLFARPTAASSDALADMQQRVLHPNKPALFTLDQVRRSVRDAVNLRDRQLRAEYEQTLHRLLQEQFECFSRCLTQDHMSINNTHLESYIS